MKRSFVLLILLVVCSCKSAKQNKQFPETTSTEPIEVLDEKVAAIIDYAKQYEGVRYKYGGTTKRGMDCSGLIYTAFKNNDLQIPRTTKALKTTGDWIDLKTVREGDLLFFATKKNSRRVNHVGLVTYAKNDNVLFIHATTSNGVIISSLAERYWYFAFVQARRVL
ncbi:MAG: C40 family peptidase [Winogradskyella sp.]|nr:C40 family peptidase [Winogradskyella sp.]